MVPSTSRTRMRRLMLVVGVAVGAATAGWLAGQSVLSPGEATSRAPEPSPITVPVERRVIQNAVVVRGTVRYAAQFDLSVDSDLGDGSLGALVLTGRLPAPGAELAEGAVAVEVSGRPIFVLQGSLPMYRGLRPGVQGEDVRQLESALHRLGFFVGTPDTTYDQTTAAAVRALYADAGYTAVGLSTEEQQQLAAAQQQLDSARAQRVAAEQALAEATAGPPRSQVLAAQGEVEQAQFAVEQAQRAYDEAVAAGADPAEIARLEAELAAAKNRLAVAQAQLEELTAPPDTAALQRAVADARAAEQAAQRHLTQLNATLGFRIPRGEVVFVPSLPRQVGLVNAKVGDTVEGPVLSLTASSVQVDISLSAREKDLVAVGAAAQLDDSVNDISLTGTVAFIADTPGTDGAPPGSYYARIELADADPQQVAGLNLRVRIPVQSTDGPVLAVPVAALVTDASGEVTVRVRQPDGDGFRERDVRVEVGLSADGFAQVTPVDGELAEGDLVVVGSQW
jgi:Membrane protein involved in colicin uptake